MSWWITLTNAGPVERFQEGGTQPVGGTTEPELNVSYNYSEVFALFNWHPLDLEGKSAAETVPKLQELTSALARFQPYPKDYWAPTPGNCGRVVSRLLSWAKLYPAGIWEVR